MSVALAGCGIRSASTGTVTRTAAPLPTDPVAAIATASTRTTAARTARIALRETTVESGRTATVTATGAIDFTRDAATLAGTDSDGERLDVRVIGSVVYVRMPPGTGADPGKQWIKIDSGQSAADQGLSGGTTNPAAGLSVLRKGARTATVVGPAIARDTRVTRYRVVVDLLAAIQDQSPAVRNGLRAAFANRPTVSEEVWIDDAGLVRRVVVAPIRVRAKEGVSSEAETIDFYDFGTPVGVAAPPAAETEDLAALMREAQDLLASPTP